MTVLSEILNTITKNGSKIKQIHLLTSKEAFNKQYIHLRIGVVATIVYTEYQERHLVTD